MENINLHESITDIILPTIKLLLCDEYMDIMDLYIAAKETGIHEDEIIKTKCGYMSNAIMYLLNYKYHSNIDPNLFHEYKKDKLYEFELGGIQDKIVSTEFFGITTNIYRKSVPCEPSHKFILFYETNGWCILDSYLGERSLSYRHFDISTLINILNSLKEKYDKNLWGNLTDVYNDKFITSDPDKINLYIIEYDYDINNINNLYTRLIHKILNRIEIEGELSDEYSYLLDPIGGDSTVAKIYLQSLLL